MMARAVVAAHQAGLLAPLLCMCVKEGFSFEHIPQPSLTRQMKSPFFIFFLRCTRWSFLSSKYER